LSENTHTVPAQKCNTGTATFKYAVIVKHIAKIYTKHLYSEGEHSEKTDRRTSFCHPENAL